MRQSPPWDELGEQERLRRHVRSVGVYHLVVSGLALAFCFGSVGSGHLQAGIFAALAFAVHAAVGLGVWRFRSPARHAALVLSVPSMVAFPVGTFAGVYSIVYLRKGKALFG